MRCAVRRIKVHVCLCHGRKKGLRTHLVFEKVREVEAQHFT